MLIVATATIAAPAAAHDDVANEADEYLVRPGDTLSEIAAQVTATVQTLIALNSIDDPDRIIAGRSLTLPKPGGGGGDSESGTHAVAPGETLSEIAARYGLSVSGLAAANGLSDANVVWVGSRLRLAAEAPALPEPHAATSHRVREGETLSEIASRYGVSLDDLVAANGLSDPDHVIAGTSLRVPGAWQCPVPGGARFVNDFGVAKSDGRFHQGVDLFAPAGTPVVAPVGGTAQQINGTRGGKQYELAGDDGVTYTGTHLQSFGASGRVAPGEVLGYVGTSGNATGTDPHLHFELRPGEGPPANPYPILVRACPT